MVAPDRAREVKQLCDQHPEAFGPPAETNDSRRLTLLLTTLIPFLNGLDGGLWGCLVKTNQGGKMPCDIIVWKDTMELFDVMTGSGACWIPVGRITDPAWMWRAVAPAPPPEVTPIPPAPITNNEQLVSILARLDALETRLAMLSDHVVSIDRVADEALHRPYPRYVCKWGPLTLVSRPEGS